MVSSPVACRPLTCHSLTYPDTISSSTFNSVPNPHPALCPDTRKIHGEDAALCPTIRDLEAQADGTFRLVYCILRGRPTNSLTLPARMCLMQRQPLPLARPTTSLVQRQHCQSLLPGHPCTQNRVQTTRQQYYPYSSHQDVLDAATISSLGPTNHLPRSMPTLPVPLSRLSMHQKPSTNTSTAIPFRPGGPVDHRLPTSPPPPPLTNPTSWP